MELVRIIIWWPGDNEFYFQWLLDIKRRSTIDM